MKAAELMQQWHLLCPQPRALWGKGACCPDWVCLCSCGKTCLVCVSQQSSYHSSPRDVSGPQDLCGNCGVDMKMEEAGGQLFLSSIVSIRNQYLFGNAHIKVEPW